MRSGTGRVRGSYPILSEKHNLHRKLSGGTQHKVVHNTRWYPIPYPIRIRNWVRVGYEIGYAIGNAIGNDLLLQNRSYPIFCRKIGYDLPLSRTRPVPDPDRVREFYTLEGNIGQFAHCALVLGVTVID